MFIYAIELEIQGSRLEVMPLMVYRYELFLDGGNVFYVLFRFLFLDKYSSYLLIHFVSTVQARTKFEQTLEETENWLYEDGEDQSKKVYQDKLDELKVNLFSRKCWKKKMGGDSGAVSVVPEVNSLSKEEKEWQLILTPLLWS